MMKRGFIPLLMLALGSSVGCDDTNPPTIDGGMDSGHDSGTDGAVDSGTDGMVADPCPSSLPADINVTANITTNTTWCGGHTYHLQDRIYVLNNSTLTLQPGTRVVSDLKKRALGAVNPDEALVFTMGSKIDAVGTASQPIVFTSEAKPVSQDATSNRGATQGAFGGLVLFGQAPVNIATPAGNSVLMEGLNDDVIGTAHVNKFGGNDPTSSCGTLKYVRVEWGGFQFYPDKEFNGITFAGCGSGTTASYIQVHRSWDDGVEFFGGSPNIDHVLITGPDDDGYDWDNGYSGHAQYMIVHQYGTGNSDKGIEADNDANGDAANPRTNPEIYNLTLLGSGSAGRASQRCMHMRRATLGRIHHTICDSWGDNETTTTPGTTPGIFFEPPTTANEANYVSTHWASSTATAAFVVDYSIFRNAIISALDYTGCAGGDCWNTAMGKKVAPMTSTTAAVPPDGILDSSTEQQSVLASSQSISTNTVLSDAARHNDVGASTSPSLFTIADKTAPNYCPLTTAVAVTDTTTAPSWADSAGLAYAGGCARTNATDAAWYDGWTTFEAP